MGARVAVIIGKEYVEKGNLELRLLHKHLIRSVLNDEASDAVGDIHDVLREKVRGFDIDHLEQLGFRLRSTEELTKTDGYSIYSGFSNLYWNLIQTLSCVKTYSASIYSCVCCIYLLLLDEFCFCVLSRRQGQHR